MKASATRNAIRMLLAAVLFIAGCGIDPNVPPEIVLDRTACSECRMLVSDLRFASALRTSDGDERVFDDSRCLFDALERIEAEGSPRIWVHDHESGLAVEAREAAFVLQERIHGPMGGDVVCAIDLPAATRLAAALEGRVVPTFEELVALRRAER
jgi:copper chaperone NosL